MQFLPTFTTLFLALTAAVTASPTPVASTKRACTTVYPTLQVPVDSSASTIVYGASDAVTLWKNSSGNRNMLFNFNVPTGASNCKLKFHAVANPPMSISGSVSVNAYVLGSAVVSNNNWRNKPARTGLAGTAALSVSSTAATDITVVTQACTSGGMNYELEVQNTASLSFTSDANNGIYMTYGC